MLLACDTATAAVSLAVIAPSGEVLAAAELIDAKSHTEQFVPLVAQVLAQAELALSDLSGVVAGMGPGPFTSLRVGLTSAQTLALTQNLPLYGVCSLDSLAWQAMVAGGAEEFIVATDARRKEVYWARYRVREGWIERWGDPAVAKPDQVDREGLPVVGIGAQVYPSELGPEGTILHGSATGLAQVAIHAQGQLMVQDDTPDWQPCALVPFAPMYLRRPDAVEPGQRKSVLA